MQANEGLVLEGVHVRLAASAARPGPAPARHKRAHIPSLLVGSRDLRLPPLCPARGQPRVENLAGGGSTSRRQRTVLDSSGRPSSPLHSLRERGWVRFRDWCGKRSILRVIQESASMVTNRTKLLMSASSERLCHGACPSSAADAMAALRVVGGERRKCAKCPVISPFPPAAYSCDLFMKSWANVVAPRPCEGRASAGAGRAASPPESAGPSWARYLSALKEESSAPPPPSLWMQCVPHSNGGPGFPAWALQSRAMRRVLTPFFAAGSATTDAPATAPPYSTRCTHWLLSGGPPDGRAATLPAPGGARS